MIDLVKIRITAGKGGNGCVSFRREKFVHKGGPDGGDGGGGGNVVIKGDVSTNTLIQLRYKSTINARAGQHGGGKQKKGARGKDETIRVPIGTVIWRINDNGRKELIGDVLDTKGITVAKGGTGGKGNKRYATPTNRTPRIAETGGTGEKARLELELKTLADVGLIGMPNAGKSTLISTCSAASPKIANYPFTTLNPVLGTVEHRYKSFLAVEIPGLIKGAHKGAGLGLDFLRHAERTRVIWHLVDGSEPNIEERIGQVNSELEGFGAGLYAKPQVLVITKIDIEEKRKEIEKAKAVLEGAGKEVHLVSSKTGEGVGDLIEKTMATLVTIYDKEQREGPITTKETNKRIIEPEAGVIKQEWGFWVKDPRAERLFGRANQKDYRVRLQLWGQLRKMGIIKTLERMGVKAGDLIAIGDTIMEWE
jgi:GTP-binding protein